ncbi:MAG TPA: hypothetical protein VFR11_15480, partial [Micromonosporaceae bacterium]|nr:hypothetical protein [Micromonosporaceae bacterium]
CAVPVNAIAPTTAAIAAPPTAMRQGMRIGPPWGRRDVGMPPSATKPRLGTISPLSMDDASFNPARRKVNA